MISQTDSYWGIIFIILIFLAAFFAFYLTHYFYYFVEGHGNNLISCNEIKNYYNENQNIVIQGYLPYNCTINGTTIPAGNRIIKIENKKIYYI